MAGKKKAKAAEDEYQPPRYHKTLDQWRVMIIEDAHRRAMTRKAERAQAVLEEDTANATSVA